LPGLSETPMKFWIGFENGMGPCGIHKSGKPLYIKTGKSFLGRKLVHQGLSLKLD